MDSTRGMTLNYTHACVRAHTHMGKGGGEEGGGRERESKNHNSNFIRKNSCTEAGKKP